ncbi:MAG: hypothetical protein ABI051_10425 [Vicinamibacterales bacterium]
MLPQTLHERGVDLRSDLPGTPRNASELREEFRQFMRRYPPSLLQLLRLDPTLMSNEAFLAAYPDLIAYLRARPEIRRDPTFFVGSSGQSDAPPRTAEQERFSAMMRMWQDTSAGLFIFAIGVGIVLTFTWVLRYSVGHRRWLRSTRLQSEFHGRLIERIGSNQELLAYIQSPAGSHFLQAAPIAAEPASVSLGAPINRILWSTQVGIVAVSVGVGLLIVRRYMFEEVGQMLLVLGSLAVSLGIGFVLAAVASYLLSHRLGLLDKTIHRQGDAPAA